MRKSIESKIRLNVVLMYLFIALVCGGFIFYFYSLSEQLRTQRTTFEEYYEKISIVNDLTQSVNQMQIEANLYVHTRNIRHLNNFRQQMNGIEHTIDSLRITYQLPADTIWDEISVALQAKENSIIALNELLTAQTETTLSRDRTTNRTIREIENFSIIMPSDTIIHEGERQSFRQRVRNVFNPNERTDTVIVVRQEQTTIVQENIETNIDDLFEKLRQIQANYNRRISVIGEQIKQLVVADQEISSRISDLLIELNTQIIHSRWQELENEEAQLRASSRKALRLGIIALIVGFIFIILILVNVNKGYQLRKDLEEANRKKREIMESRHKLLLSVSHDVKTPLSSILGYLELSRQKEKLAEKEIASMQNSGNHILALLNNLLEFSALEQGNLQLAHTNFSLNELCDELYEMFAPLARAKKLSFECQKDFNPAQMIYSDQLKMKQILTNVLSNAVKYTSKGSVVFKTSYKNEVVSFAVIDTGAGIPKDKISGVYQPFTRVDENNSLAEGSGFGMYVVKGLVQLFGGKIQFQSKERKGTTVSIDLPAVEGSAKSTDHTLKKILIVDDDVVFAKMLSNVCNQLGHKTITCKTWNELEKELSPKSDFNLVLTDMELPDFSGNDVLQKIKEFDAEIPVFLMTGRMDYNTQLAQSEGFSNYTSKPISVKNLYLLIGGIWNENQETPAENFLSETPDEAMIEVIEEFLFAAINNVVELREAVEKDDFERVQSICHKMRPMCVQLNAPENLTAIMQEIDLFRQQTVPKSYNWKEKTLFLADGLEEFLGEVNSRLLV